MIPEFRRLALIATVLVVTLVALPGAQRQRPAAPFALEEATFQQLQQWMESGRYTSEALVRMYLERIRALDDGGR